MKNSLIMSESSRILVLYATQTFTAQEVAERIWRTTKCIGFRGPVQSMDSYPISKLIHEKFAIFVCATAGQGDEPDNMKKFWKFLLRKNLPTNSLSGLKFGVLGLGDSSYTKFNFVAKKLNKRLVQLGATPLLDIGLCDYQHDLGHDAVAIPWLKQYFTKLKLYFPSIHVEEIKNNFVPRWKVTLIKDTLNSDTIDDIYFSKSNDSDFIEPKLLEIESNIRTTDETHFQDVRLLTLKTIGDDILDYAPGDVFNIRPRNSKEDIDDLFSIFETHGLDIKPHHRLLVEEYHEDMPVPTFLRQPLSLYKIAEQYWDLKAYPTQYVFSLLALVSQDKLERDKCMELSSPEGQEDWLNYCRRPRRTILEVLHDFHKTASNLPIDILFELFSTIKPRSFSIASSKLPTDGQKLDILMAVVKYYTKLKKERLGLCSNWMKTLNACDKVYGWIKKGSLLFPKDVDIPLIMIGPGTGLAPFRSLIQERVTLGTASKHNIHLFFGCRYRNKDYHCREEFEKLVEDGKISIYCAFSRDQDEKIYVQHKIAQHRQALWKLITDRQAYIYISGNAKNMPDNVRDAFIEHVFGEGGNCVEEGTLAVKNLENSGRWQVEAW